MRIPRNFPLFALTAGLLSLQPLCARTIPAATWANAIAHLSRAHPEARIIILNQHSGHLIASQNLAQAAHTLATPGSAIKPLILYRALTTSSWSPDRRITCNRSLSIAGRPLHCTHPPSPPMNGQQALTWSCNTYFATLAASIPPAQFRALLEPTGLLQPTGLAHPGSGEAVAELRTPANANQVALATLGIEGLRLTPLELASAYRWLSLELAAHPSALASITTRNGLEDSASFGMANSAGTLNVPIAGKTGTASPIQGTPTHGWFAGLVPAHNPSVILVIFLPQGHGRDAAQLAAELLSHSPLAPPAIAHP